MMEVVVWIVLQVLVSGVCVCCYYEVVVDVECVVEDLSQWCEVVGGV